MVCLFTKSYMMNNQWLIWHTIISYHLMVISDISWFIYGCTILRNPLRLLGCAAEVSSPWLVTPPAEPQPLTMGETTGHGTSKWWTSKHDVAKLQSPAPTRWTSPAPRRPPNPRCPGASAPPPSESPTEDDATARGCGWTQPTSQTSNATKKQKVWEWFSG